MNAFRTFVKVKNNEVRVKLPKTFKDGKVEVIVIVPAEKDKKESPDGSTLSDLQKLLLAAPELTDEELSLIEEKRKALNQWN